MEVKQRLIKNLVTKLGSVSEQNRIEALSELRTISKSDAISRPLISDSGAIPYLSETLFSDSEICQENAAATLHNLTISSKDEIMSTSGVLDALSHVLRNPASPFACQCASATIFNLLMVEAYRPIIGQKRDILYALIGIVKCPGSTSRTIQDAVKALFGIALYPVNRAQVIELGAVGPLFSLVCKDGRVGFVEDSTAVIAQLAGCEESWEAFKKVSGVRILVDLLDQATGSSYRTRENVVSALLNMARCGSDEVDVVEGLRGVIGVEAVEGILDVAENGTEKGKRKASELLKILDLENQLVELVEGRDGYLSSNSSFNSF
ncbi:hypothetical protein Leryth_025146 [Lithospermum erythrorhizon]|nr:hypothetical protein Leryth_025146 [Lithospermum erythrorhizon]